MKRLAAVTLLLALPVLAPPALAGSPLLPRGIGMIQVGDRSYATETDAYDAGGNRTPIAGKYARELDGKSLISGAGGSDLQRLAAEIDRLDPGSGGNRSLLNELDLGQVETRVAGHINAEFLGTAYGLTDRWTLFAGIPYIHAAVDADLEYHGANNAAAIKAKLGGYAYGALQTGLDQAAALDQQRIAAAFSSLGYEPLGHWEKSGVGDFTAGGRTWLERPLGPGFQGGLLLVPSLSVPTGYVESPDILQDVSFGTGYYSTGVAATPSVLYRGHYRAKLPTSYQHNYPTSVRKRVPLGDESLVDSSRTRSVSLTPGDDTDLGLGLGGTYGAVDLDLQHGVRRHYGDRYSGALAGNYGALSADSDKEQTYRLVTVKLDSTAAYLQHRFAVPAILELSAFQTLGGRNCLDERYYQLAVSTFLAAGRK